MRVLLLLVFAFCLGCDGPPKPPPPTPVHDLEPFIFIEGGDVNVLNVWRTQNPDKRVVAFDGMNFSNSQNDGISDFVVYYEKNPGSSRQVFVFEGREKDWLVEELDRIALKYPNKRMVDFCLVGTNRTRGIIVCLEDILDPYLPSNK